MSTVHRAALLSIGDELLLGEITDTNKPYMAQQLLPLGITVRHTETVGDEMADIVAAFRRALDQADVVLSTGGLGPTDDDLTFEALAKTLGVELEFFPEVLEQMATRFKRSIESLGPGNRKQAVLPAGACVLQNDWGTAPGLHYIIAPHSTANSSAREKHVFLMPGVPSEMKGLLHERIIPILREKFPSPRVILMRKFHSFGTPESTIGEKIKPLMAAGKNPDVGTRVGGGVVTVRLVAHGASASDALAALASTEPAIREALGPTLFGEDDETLASATLKALTAKNKTVALAESCTAGLVSSMLAEVPGASSALMETAVVYSNAAKTRTCGVSPETLKAHGAVSKETAAELATGIRQRAGTDIAVSITGIAGPDGGTAEKPVGLVWFGIATASGVRTLEKRYLGLQRNVVRERAAMQALDLIRRAALE